MDDQRRVYGIAGSVYAYWMSYIEPAAVFDMTIAIKSFIMFLLGGSGTVLGPVMGSFFFNNKKVIKKPLRTKNI